MFLHEEFWKEYLPSSKNSKTAVLKHYIMKTYDWIEVKNHTSLTFVLDELSDQLHALHPNHPEKEPLVQTG